MINNIKNYISGAGHAMYEIVFSNKNNDFYSIYTYCERILKCTTKSYFLTFFNNYENIESKCKRLDLFLKACKCPNVLKNFYHYFLLKNKIHYMYEIIEMFKNISKSNIKKKEGFISSSKKLNDKMKKKLISFLKKQFDVSNYIFNVDPSIKYGIKLTIDSITYDYTLSNRLSNIFSSLEG